jgi:hypothetical protein
MADINSREPGAVANSAQAVTPTLFGNCIAHIAKGVLAVLALLVVLSAGAQAQYITGTSIDTIVTGTTVTTGTSIIILKYTGVGGNVSIPGTLNGLPVSQIAASAFASNYGLTGVTIPGSVTSIGSNAFENCAGLSTIIIPDSVITIGDSAFSHCSGLSSAKLGAGLTSLGAAAFEKCAGLSSVTFGESLASIGSSAFAHCTGLTSITLPYNLVSIGDQAFSYCNGLNSITIPPATNNIGFRAFSYCNSLTSIRISSGVTNIGDYAFADCVGLTTITPLPLSLTSIGDHSFANCNGLKTLSFPTGMTSIGDYAFTSCNGLQSLTTGDGVSYVGNYAFSDCPALKTVKIGNRVSSIGDGAFAGCKMLSSLTLGNHVTSIGSSSFAHCEGLTSLVFPSTLTSIGDYAFSNCLGLTDLTIPYGVTSIGNGAFYYCYDMTFLTIPATVSSIGDNAFYECALQWVWFQGNAPSFGTQVFWYVDHQYLENPEIDPTQIPDPLFPDIYYLKGASGWEGVNPSTYYSQSIELYPWPVLTKITPNHGSPAGGEALVISGDHLADAQAVRFVSAKNSTTKLATSWYANPDGTEITVLTPSGAPGDKVVITVQMLSGTNAASVAEPYSYNAPDKSAPRVTVTATKAGTKPELIYVEGAAFDNQGIDRVEISFNGGPVQVANLGPFINGKASWNITPLSAENGKNTIVTRAYDFMGNPSSAVTTVIKYVNYRPQLAGSYNGLFVSGSSLAPSNDLSGFFTMKVAASGLFTGKVLIGGLTFPVSGIFGNDGNAHFGKNLDPTIPLVANRLEPVLLGNLALNLATDNSAKITGSLTDGNSAVLTSLNADRAYFDGKTPATTVSPAFLHNKGHYTLIFASKAQPGSPSLADYPQGQGFGTYTLSAKGVGTLKATLADGSVFTASAPISKDYKWPCFAQLYKKGGSVAGALSFDGTNPIANILGTDILWFRPVMGTSLYYPGGWGNGIVVDVAGCEFANIRGISVFPVAKPVDGINGNALLQFWGALLTSKAVNVDPLSSKATNLAFNGGVDKSFSLSISSSGLFGGSFTDTDTTKPKFQGAILQNDIPMTSGTMSAGGYGFYLTTPGLGGTGFSANVTLKPQ